MQQVPGMGLELMSGSLTFISRLRSCSLWCVCAHTRTHTHTYLFPCDIYTHTCFPVVYTGTHCVSPSGLDLYLCPTQLGARHVGVVLCEGSLRGNS